MEGLEKIVFSSEKKTREAREQRIINMGFTDGLKRKLIYKLEIDTIGQLLDTNYNLLKDILTKSELYILKVEMASNGYIFKGDYIDAYKELGISENVAFVSVKMFDISSRTINALCRGGIYTLGQLLTIDYEDILGISDLGQVQINKLKDYIHSLGYKLKNEKPFINDVRRSLRAQGIQLLEDVFKENYVYTPLYRAQIYTMDDLEKCRENIFQIVKFSEKGKQKYTQRIKELQGESTVTSDNQIIQNRIKQKEKLIVECDSLMEERLKLLAREKELDKLIEEKIQQLQATQKGHAYGKK